MRIKAHFVIHEAGRNQNLLIWVRVLCSLWEEAKVTGLRWHVKNALLFNYCCIQSVCVDSHHARLMNRGSGSSGFACNAIWLLVSIANPEVTHSIRFHPMLLHVLRHAVSLWMWDTMRRHTTKGGMLWTPCWCCLAPSVQLQCFFFEGYAAYV